MAVEPQELNHLFQGDNWPNQTSFSEVANEQEAEQMGRQANLRVFCLLSCMILVGAVGPSTFYSLTAGDKSFLLKGEPRMEVASRELAVGSSLTYRAAAVATKEIVEAAAKKKKGKMGVGT